MTDLYDLLERAAGPAAAASPAQLEADVARGRRALRRRRTGAAGGVVTVAVAAAALPLATGGLPLTRGSAAVPGGPGKPPPTAGSTHTDLSTKQVEKIGAVAELAQQDAVKKARLHADLLASRVHWRTDGSAVPLRPYDGPPLAGSFQPGLLPAGSLIQGGNAYRLTIARRGDPDTNADSLAGKVVVRLSGHQLTSGPARIAERNTFSTVVVVPLATPIHGATTFEVQFPPGLGWSDSQAIAFASSIHVLSTALGPKA
jgi:hypothetical protein